ncbi:hypothetical protein ANO14919_040760 [Xylariales sp. No.14919]|nr:hypothetical protein ANO14919_040760 [Xylariales sp. No.14919]
MDEDPYENYMEIELSLVKGDDNPIADWLCRTIVEELEATALAFAPGLSEEELFTGLELESICE